LKIVVLLFVAMFCLPAFSADSSVPYLDATLSLIGENKGIATVFGGWLMNIVWKVWPTSNPSGLFQKCRDVLMAIKQKKIIDKLIDLCDVFLAIFDTLLSPVPNREKKK